MPTGTHVQIITHEGSLFSANGIAWDVLVTDSDQRGCTGNVDNDVLKQ